MSLPHAIILIFSILAATAQLFVQRFSGNQTNYYYNQHKPPNQPPGFVFGIVWGLLITITAILNFFTLRFLLERKDKVMTVLFVLVALTQSFLESYWLIKSNQQIDEAKQNKQLLPRPVTLVNILLGLVFILLVKSFLLFLTFNRYGERTLLSYVLVGLSLCEPMWGAIASSFGGFHVGRVMQKTQKKST